MTMDSPATVVIITTQSFPSGLAGTNRIFAYSKGFLHHGFQPEILCIRPTEAYNNIFNSAAQGNFEEISFAYPGGTPIRVSSFLVRRINDLIAIIYSLKRLRYLLKENKVSFVIFYGNYFLPELLCLFLAKLYGKKIYKEESENPNVRFAGSKSFFALVGKWLYVNKLYVCYSGLLVMTNALRDFFLAKGILDKKILVVPQTIDIKRFDNNFFFSNLSLPDTYIAYVGSLKQEKDGVLTLVESFVEISVKYSEIQLLIAGEGTQQEQSALLSLIMQFNMNDRIHYIGRISSNEIPVFLQRAKLLVSCRPQSIQSDYGFPTKVVEYLATGKPVVTTATGDLAFYLKDRGNAFVANSADPVEFSEKVIEVLDNYDFALKVALKGKELVKTQFNPLIQSKKIINFWIKTT